MEAQDQKKQIPNTPVVPPAPEATLTENPKRNIWGIVFNVVFSLVYLPVSFVIVYILTAPVFCIAAPCPNFVSFRYPVFLLVLFVYFLIILRNIKKVRKIMLSIILVFFAVVIFLYFLKMKNNYNESAYQDNNSRISCIPLIEDGIEKGC